MPDYPDGRDKPCHDQVGLPRVLPLLLGKQLVERFHETNHMHGLVILGRHRTSAVADVRIV
jgi:hypothetical protein